MLLSCSRPWNSIPLWDSTHDAPVLIRTGKLTLLGVHKSSCRIHQGLGTTDRHLQWPWPALDVAQRKMLIFHQTHALLVSIVINLVMKWEDLNMSIYSGEEGSSLSVRVIHRPNLIRANGNDATWQLRIRGAIKRWCSWGWVINDVSSSKH